MNLGADVVAAAGVVEVVLAEAGVVGTLKLNVGALDELAVVFCWSEPKAPFNDEEVEEGKTVVELVVEGFGAIVLLGTLKVNFRGVFVDVAVVEDEVADAVGCTEGVVETLLVIGFGLAKENDWVEDCAGVGFDGSGAEVGT